MKKITKIGLIVCCFFMIGTINGFSQEEVNSSKEKTVISVPQNEKKQYIQDEYVDEYVEKEQPKAEIKKSKSKKEKKSDGFFDGFFTPKQKKYHFYETIPLSTGTIGFKIKPREAELFLIPETSKIGIQVYYQTSYFDIIFDQKDVAFIQDAFSKYLQDFDQKKLIRKKSQKTRRMYGAKGKCRVEWGTIKSMMNNYGDTNYHLGYEFKDNSPYFTIIVKDAKNIATDLGSNVSEKSVEIQLYFTKAQVKTLLDNFSRERLQTEYSALTGSDTYSSDEY